MLDLMVSWNRWGNAALSPGKVREVTSTIYPFIHTRDVVVLMGPRRAGKSTVLYQLMTHLEENGVESKAMLHINFEEPTLSPELGLALLDKLYYTYRTEIFPKGKAYLFLDEIQNVPEWEKWVRARNETEDIKVFITGSSSQLLSRELATLLTGRHVSFNVYPLSFREFLTFNDIVLPSLPYTFRAPTEIQYALNQYMTWGGFPEVVLSTEDVRREKLLTQYFDDVLFKDVALRYNIRDLMSLRNLAVHLLTQTGGLITYKRLANIFSVSPELARDYCCYLQEAFLMELMPIFSLKTAIRQRHPQKIHAIDGGLRNSVSFSTAPDKGKLIESLVFQSLLRKNKSEICYWKENGEVDFLIKRGANVSDLIQVVYEGLGEKEVFEREIGALEEANHYFPAATRQLIVVEKPTENIVLPQGVLMKPLWQFLLEH